jgi:hypothetical protein
MPAIWPVLACDCAMAGTAAEQRHSTSSTAHSEWNGFGFDISCLS